MRPIVIVLQTELAWSVGQSRSRAVQKRLNRSMCRLGRVLGWAGPRNRVLDGVQDQISHGNGQFWGGGLRSMCGGDATFCQITLATHYYLLTCLLLMADIRLGDVTCRQFLAGEYESSVPAVATDCVLGVAWSCAEYSHRVVRQFGSSEPHWLGSSHRHRYAGAGGRWCFL